MMRFKENNYNRVFVGLSNLIRYICGGDRLKRITKIIDELLRKKHLEKNRKLKILDFGCGSMEISKKLKDKIYVEQIVGSDIFKHKYKSNKILYIDNNRLFKKKTSPIELKPGSVIGLLSLINNSHPKDALIAGAKCLVLVINRELFEKLLHEFPDFNKNLKSKLVSDLNKKVSSLQTTLRR